MGLGGSPGMRGLRSRGTTSFTHCLTLPLLLPVLLSLPLTPELQVSSRLAKCWDHGTQLPSGAVAAACHNVILIFGVSLGLAKRKVRPPKGQRHASSPLLDTHLGDKIGLLFRCPVCPRSCRSVNNQPGSTGLLSVQIPGKTLIAPAALSRLFPLFSLPAGVDETRDQSRKVCRLPPACQPGRIARRRRLQLCTLCFGWDFFLPGVFTLGILLLMGHHRQDYQHPCCSLPHSPPPGSHSQAFPASSFS